MVYFDALSTFAGEFRETLHRLIEKLSFLPRAWTDDAPTVEKKGQFLTFIEDKLSAPDTPAEKALIRKHQ